MEHETRAVSRNRSYITQCNEYVNDPRDNMKGRTNWPEMTQWPLEHFVVFTDTCAAYSILLCVCVCVCISVSQCVPMESISSVCLN